jgi:hypothetical protein
MKHFLLKNIRILFYAFWFFSLALQAFFTELMYDEAYYYMYSTQLAWGYFDHPPAIAFFIKGGYLLFNNELGVRLLPIIASTLTIFLWEKIIQPKELILFYLLVLAIGIIHFMGFLALADNPLLLTAAFFFWVYQKFINQPNIKYALLIGLVAGCLLLSKYHGIIIIGFTLLSNPKLLRNKYFYLAFIPFLGVLIPHVLWQYQNDFPSIKYHLFERSITPYSYKYTLEYLITQPFILGPFTGILFFIAAWKLKSQNQFEKTLKYLFWGGYLFFFLMTFKDRVEAHWTLFIVFPALYFGYKYITQHLKSKKIFYYFGCTSVVLILLLRVFISLDLEKDSNAGIAKITKQFHSKNAMLSIHKQAKNIPVDFMNSYKNASLYSFYSKSIGFSLNNSWGRKNQFDIWNVEQQHRGEKIYLIANYNVEHWDSIPNLPSKKYKIINNFQAYSKIKIIPEFIKGNPSILEKIPVKVKFENTQKEVINLEANKQFVPVLYYQFFKGKRPVQTVKVAKISNNSLENEMEFIMVTPGHKGNYTVSFGLKAGWLPTSINSDKFKIQIK